MQPQIIGILNQDNFQEYISESASEKALDELFVCDILEFRGDTFMPREIPEKLEELSLFLSKKQENSPILLFTLRLAVDGGKWMGSPASRQEIWQKCFDSGLINWIDIEIEEIENYTPLVKQIHGSDKVNLVLSHHNFTSSYSVPQFQQKLEMMELFAPDIVKFAVTLQSREDFIEMLTFSKILSQKFALSGCISMGIWGKLSRIGSPLTGAPLTYGYLGKAEVIPGQFNVKKLDKYLKLIKNSIPDGASTEELVTLLENQVNDE